jgi:ATP-dependent protease ClpP protease subunit
MPWINVPQQPGASRARARAREDARPGFEIRNAASGDEAELLVYDEIDSWWGVSAGDVISELAQVTAPNLRVRINSPGGSVFEGLAIANALRAHPANVIVQVDGLAASIASVIAMAGDRLVMMPNSMLMVHEASGLCIGDATDMQQMADVLSKISDNIAGAYAAKAGGTPDEWRATMRAETWYLPEDAVTAGLADEAIAAKPPADDPAEPDMHARWDLTVYGYQGPRAPEKPKPGPPAIKAQGGDEPAPTLTIPLGDALGEQLVAALRSAVAAPADASAETPGTDPAEAAPADAVEPSPPDPAPAVPADPAVAEPVAPADATFADIVARLIKPKPTTWAEAISQLTRTTSSSSATES